MQFEKCPKLNFFSNLEIWKGNLAAGPKASDKKTSLRWNFSCSVPVRSRPISILASLLAAPLRRVQPPVSDAAVSLPEDVAPLLISLQGAVG